MNLELSGVRFKIFPFQSLNFELKNAKIRFLSVQIGGCGPQQTEETTRVWLPPSQPGGAAEEGVLTQTRDTVVCPRCERVFAPDRHLDFLDHFEQCPADTAAVAHFTLNNLN
jgi:hypothetical protein